jgi:tRNA uridine 5-carboxymethylaminomethyl modification enzyme
MFTSRAELRLLLDIDSADLRLTERGHDLGLISEARFERFTERRDRLANYMQIIDNTQLTPTTEIVERGRETLGITLQSPTTPALLLRRGDVSLAALEEFLGDLALPRLDDRERRFVEARLRYGGYIERQRRDLDRLRREEERVIPDGFDYAAIPGLSREVVEKLTRIRPASLAQAGRVSGITPAALSLINIHLEKTRRQRRLTSETCPSRPRRRTDSRCSAESLQSPAPPAPADRA